MTPGSANVRVSKSSVNVHSATGDMVSCLELRRLDWNRFKHNLAKAAKGRSGFDVWYALFFGISAPTALTAATLASGPKVEPWIPPAYWIAAAATAVLGIVLLVIHKRLGRLIEVSAQDVLEDMNEVERCFYPSPGPTEGATPAAAAPPVLAAGNVRKGS